MNLEIPVDRRDFLLLALGAGSAALMAKLAPWRALVEVVDRPLAARLAALLEHRSSAEVVGKEYLRAAPASERAESLVTAIASRLPGGRQGARAASRSELHALVVERVRTDFDEGLTVKLQGWIVSRTEARLCALAAVAGRIGPADVRPS